MQINGLPAHILLVHLVVVLLPLTAAAAVVASLWPAAQRKLTFLIPLGAVVGLVAVPLTTRAGNDLAAQLGNPTFIDRHRQLGNMVWPWATALAVTTIVQWAYLRRPAFETGAGDLDGGADSRQGLRTSNRAPQQVTTRTSTSDDDRAVRGRHGRLSRLRIALAALVIASAVGTAAIVALTGDAGARAVWGNR